MNMDGIDIIIPTCKSVDVVKDLVDEIEENTEIRHRVIATCTQVSAAVNRNNGLDRSTTPLYIMLDDDITGFYRGWARELIQPLLDDNEIKMVSARLMGKRSTPGKIVDENQPGYMIGDSESNPDLQSDIFVSPKQELPTACIAMRRDDIRFHEGFRGCGFEDNHFCWLIVRKYPSAKFVINNKVKLIHKTEMKNQGGVNWTYNRQLFNKLTGLNR